MVQRMMRDSQPAECAAGDSAISMGDVSALILIQHCNNMKQQETRLRLVTLLVLLVSIVLVLFANGLHPWHQGNFGSAGRAGKIAPSAALLSQDKVCQPEPEQSNLSATSQRWRIHLTSSQMNKVIDRQYIAWDGPSRRLQSKNIVIPQAGFYFVYVRTTLRCQNQEPQAAVYVPFKLEVHSWNKGYNKTITLAEAWDGVDCSRGSDVSTNLFVGEIFDLLQGDHVSVWIREGSVLLSKSVFGAYVT